MLRFLRWLWSKFWVLLPTKLPPAAIGNPWCCDAADDNMRRKLRMIDISLPDIGDGGGGH
jgi:hypothetical protein